MRNALVLDLVGFNHISMRTFTLQEVLEILEGMPLGKTTYLKIAESEEALKALRKTQPELNMRSIEDHNVEAIGKDLGHASAIKKLTNWRNGIYLKLKGMKND
jgi:hypothetical protein